MKIIRTGTFFFLALWIGVSFGPDDGSDLLPFAAAADSKPDILRVIQGGLLYDKWWKVVPGAVEPSGNQPLWSLQSTNKRKGSATWRCKECHGWDYKGKGGAYGTGSHRTGFPGILKTAQKKSVEELAIILRGSNNKEHDFSSVIHPQGIRDLAAFLKGGLIDMTQYVDYETKKPIGGNVIRGKTLFVACVSCHGPDGKKTNFRTEKNPEYVGTIAKENPQEFLHKTRMGQPGSDPPMISALSVGWNVEQQLDLLAYGQTLPDK